MYVRYCTEIRKVFSIIRNEAGNGRPNVENRKGIYVGIKQRGDRPVQYGRLACTVPDSTDATYGMVVDVKTGAKDKMTCPPINHGIGSALPSCRKQSAGVVLSWVMGGW
jgi:hypothetical protein